MAVREVLDINKILAASKERPVTALAAKLVTRTAPRASIHLGSCHTSTSKLSLTQDQPELILMRKREEKEEISFPDKLSFNGILLFGVALPSQIHITAVQPAPVFPLTQARQDT